MENENEEKKIFNKLVDLGLIFAVQKCTKENCRKKAQNMNLTTRKRSKDSKNCLLTWRCNSCSSYKTIYEDSFFSLFRKPLKIVLAIIKCWAAQITIAKTVDQIKLHFEHEVHRNTVALLFFRLRQLCTVDIDKRNLKLGGKSKIVEIDDA
ncbi:unnamed protein product [Brachionus calyciflorus]|uniref:Uncharacterized protein n=1 Tax=Brachionus calyciflorus TaxID=104777 RepID=A0A814HFU4_9BILA|nr:unnamed protein product [Brachionus calyciflorus]